MSSSLDPQPQVSIPIQSSEPAPKPFEYSADDLCDLVSFDKRTDPSHLQTFLERIESVEKLCQRLKTHPTIGLELAGEISFDNPPNSKTILDVADLKVRMEIFGLNIVPPPPSETILEMVWGTIKEDPIIKILLAGAAVTFIVGIALHPADGWIDGLAIIIAVVIVLSVTAGNDYSKDKKFKKLLLLQSDKKVKVIRSGFKDQISSWNLVVGDVVELLPGDEVPADGVFIRGSRLVIDESPLTGETFPVRKSQKQPFMFSGCQVGEGNGYMLVTGVGVRSSAGQIQALLNEKQSEETVLQEKLRDVAVKIGQIGITAGFLTFLGLLIRWGANYANENLTWDNSMILQLVKFFVVGVTIVVVAVPEGLPLAVTIALAFSMYKMIKDNCFVRHLAAAETMGDATCVCTDKTGTLTENRMTVVKLKTKDSIYCGEGSGDSNAVTFGSQTLPEITRDLLVEAVSVNSTCFLKHNTKDGSCQFVGSATEGALLVLVEKCGGNYDHIRTQKVRVPNGDIEFSSNKKRMTTTIEPIVQVIGSRSHKHRVHCKGASEIVLGLCTKTIDPNTGHFQVLESSERRDIESTIQSWAADGLRTVVLAFKDTNDDPKVDADTGLASNLDTDLAFLLLAGIKDPIRKEVPGAVRACQNAGLVVRMVTGDNVLTATKIAKECGILTDDGSVIEGPKFREFSKEDKMQIIPKLQVLARSSPSDKFELVSLLKEMGEVVAVTGDGTNDAPALKEADVGFAMGICGTQVAMNACDIMLLDDNFASIVQAIKWGRNVLNVIRKFLQFQLSVNVSAIVIIFFGSVIHGTSPMTPVQLLWINLIMDSLGALGLASEVPEDGILNQPPHRRTESLITTAMVEQMVMIVVYEVSVTMFVLNDGYRYVGVGGGEIDLIHTLVFTTFVIMQIANEVVARQLKHELNIAHGITRNKLFLSMLLLIAIVQVIAVQLGGSFINTVGLNGIQWLGCLILGFGLIPFVWLGRALLQARRKRKLSSVMPINGKQGSELQAVKTVHASSAW